jgi:hypothetical protein
LTISTTPTGPAHGQQQLVLFHGYYEQYQYLPLVVTCAENDLIVRISLRQGSMHAALGADNDQEYLVNRIRARRPDVILHIRDDSAFRRKVGSISVGSLSKLPIRPDNTRTHVKWQTGGRGYCAPNLKLRAKLSDTVENPPETIPQKPGHE